MIYVHFIMCDLTFVILWNSLHDVGTFGFAPGNQLKSFWLVRFRTGRTTLLVSWLGAWSDAMTGASIARPWTSLPRCNRTFLPWPYNLFCLEACTLHRGQRVSFRSWKHTFEDYSIWFGSIWPCKLTFGQAAFDSHGSLGPWQTRWQVRRLLGFNVIT